MHTSIVVVVVVVVVVLAHILHGRVLLAHVQRFLSWPKFGFQSEHAPSAACVHQQLILRGANYVAMLVLQSQHAGTAMALRCRRWIA